MKKNFGDLTLIIAGCLLLMGVSPGTAEAKGLVAQRIVDTGKIYFDQGDYPKAIHELSKALLADPDNKEAKRYLNKLGIKEGFYGRQKTKLSKMAALAEDNVDKQNRLQVLDHEVQEKEKLNQILQADKEQLKNTVMAQEKENTTLSKKIRQVEKDAVTRARQDETRIKDIEKTAERKSRDIARLNADVFQLKSRAVRDLGLIKERKGEVKELEKVLKTTNKEYKSAEQKQRIHYEDEILSLDKKMNKYQHQLLIARNEHEKTVDQLKDTTRKKRRELDYYNDREIMRDYRLMDRENQIVYKSRQIAELNDSLSELEKKLAYWQKEARNSVRQQAVKRVDTDRESLERINFLKRQGRQIMALKDKLVRARQQIRSLEKDTGKNSQKKIDDLRDQLEEVRFDLVRKESDLKAKKRDYDLLEKRLLDSKERLDLVEKIMKEKDSQINDLEKQLTEVLDQFEN